MTQLITHDGSPLNPARVYLASLAEGGRRGAYYQLRSIAKLLTNSPDIDAFPWSSMSRQMVTALLALHQAKGMAPSTTNHALSILKRVAEEAMAMRMISAEECAHIHSVRRPKGSRLPPGRALTRAEVRAAIDRCLADPDTKGLRDAALISVGAGCGLRCFEIRDLSVESLQGNRLAITGKGNQQALQPVPAPTLELLEEYLEHLPATGPLFPRWRRYDAATRLRMTSSGIYYTLRRRLGEGVSPHDLRRTFATWLDQEGHQLSVVQRLMRHANPETTMRYIRNHHAANEAGEAIRF